MLFRGAASGAISLLNQSVSLFGLSRQLVRGGRVSIRFVASIANPYLLKYSFPAEVRRRR